MHGWQAHIVPVGDRREHVARADCWCEPSLYEDGVLCHNALDDRLRFERRERLPS